MAKSPSLPGLLCLIDPHRTNYTSECCQRAAPSQPDWRAARVVSQFPAAPRFERRFVLRRRSHQEYLRFHRRDSRSWPWDRLDHTGDGCSSSLCLAALQPQHSPRYRGREETRAISRRGFRGGSYRCLGCRPKRGSCRWRRPHGRRQGASGRLSILYWSRMRGIRAWAPARPPSPLSTTRRDCKCQSSTLLPGTRDRLIIAFMVLFGGRARIADGKRSTPMGYGKAHVHLQ